jgi:hypothetical protein
MKPFFRRNAECKKKKQQAAYKTSYGLVFIHCNLTKCKLKK